MHPALRIIFGADFPSHHPINSENSLLLPGPMEQIEVLLQKGKVSAIFIPIPVTPPPDNSFVDWEAGPRFLAIAACFIRKQPLILRFFDQG
jgi:hypothetical protein